MWGITKRKQSAPYKRLETKIHKAIGPGFEIIDTDEMVTPLILASPHSGRHYPEAIQLMSSLPLPSLRLGEDAYMDRVALPLAQHGIPVIHALFPRCFVDVNRGPTEIPPEFLINKGKHVASVSPRARSGLGVIPSRIAQNLEIYDQNLSLEQVHVRLERFYHPYHEGLRHLIRKAQDRFGRALLIDCHSMPGLGPSGEKRPDIILGDRYGKSCEPETTKRLETAFQALGYSVSRNNPYAGGYVTRQYGRPDANVEVIQIEISKILYLNAATLEPHAGMEKLVADFESVILKLMSCMQAVPGLAAQ